MMVAPVCPFCAKEVRPAREDGLAWCGYCRELVQAEEERVVLAPLPTCPRCGAQVPPWAMEVIDEGGGRVCIPCATGQDRAEVY